MSTTERQNNLILNEDWTRIYQTFKNADFKSYDFENLRRVIINYLRENYPEDFNDYIESSEYLALIDAVAFLGQSLSFRIDLASRENFIELAETKESVLRIAKMLSYKASRNTPAQGLLKFTTVSTTESVLDGNGRDLAQQVISWNDPTNDDWAEQFILILNAAMTDNTEFGRSQGTSTIQGISTEQYRFRTTSNDVPVFSFDKTVAGRNMSFELLSSSFEGRDTIYEEAPVPGNQLGFVYRQDRRGSGSANTGFFMLFKQGSLETADFTIDAPASNETVDVDAQNINDSDVWLYSLNSSGVQTREWTQVNNLSGNNIAFNSIQNNVRNIYAVETRENDRIRLQFADGTYGNLPRGPFRIFYRVSNGLEYTIAPNEMTGINISFDYFNADGVRHTLTIGLELQSSISNAAASEDIDSIRARAPANYYTQNRMITGEDYNLAPLTSSQNILKVRSINRTSSGISRNFDIKDATGKYSDVRMFASDGYIYKENKEIQKSFSFNNRTEIINFLRREVEADLASTGVYNFYFTNYPKIFFTDNNTVWKDVSTSNGSSTGYFLSNIDNRLLKTGSFSTSSLKYITSGALVRFKAPDGFHFMIDTVSDHTGYPAGTLMPGPANHKGSRDFIWTKVVSVQGDGTNAGRGALDNGTGPVRFSDKIPDGSIAERIVPKFVQDIPQSFETQIVNRIAEGFDFGIRYDDNTASWVLVEEQNLNLINDFSLGSAGDTSNNSLDSSWFIAFVKRPDRYDVRIRKLDYVFGSIEQNRFYFDNNDRAYNSRTGMVMQDTVSVLGINTKDDFINPLLNDIDFEISDTIRFADGFENTKEIKVAFADKDQDGVIDNPDSFEQIVGTNAGLNFLFFEKKRDEYGATIFEYIDKNLFKIAESEADIVINNENDGQLIYFYDINENRVKKIDKTTNTLILQTQYKAVYGRNDLKFEYIHNAGDDRRIDPSVSNINDLYILTRSYDTQFRNYINGLSPKPELPSGDSLRVEFGAGLNAIKSISDEIIYHPVKYKVLFGRDADPELQARFLVVKNPEQRISDNDIKVRIINAVNTFFDINNWDFGDRFYVSEMNTYIFNQLSPLISNFTIVSRQLNEPFGSLFEIQSSSDEIFISGATVDNVEIVSSINSNTIGNSTQVAISNENTNTDQVTSTTTTPTTTGTSSTTTNTQTNTGGSSY
jgi:hypothetical protein